MDTYKVTIGLEVHAELKTRTKMFCDSINDPDEKTPNVNICPVCAAHPGTLPVINKEAVKHVLKIGLAVGGTLASFTEFDRKNYFYPDIPKGYQISQYKYPLVSGGSLLGVPLTRIHLEEDTARSSHEKGDCSLVDFNRAGIPLMELVTEPVIRSADEASAFARELQLVLRTLGASDANMEKGEMRVEANISVSATETLGTKVEVKNLNSFRAVERAIAHEVVRHSKLLERGERVIQETRGWDEAKQVTFSQRLKEESHDYRYFPDPDLPKLALREIEEFKEENLRKKIPELPAEKRVRLVREFGVKAETAEMFVRNRNLGTFFEDVAGKISDKKGFTLAENYITSDLAGMTNESGDFGNVTADTFAALMNMILEQKVSSRGAKEILVMLHQQGGNPHTVAEQAGLLQKSDESELKNIISDIIAQNQNIVQEYKKGKTSSLQFLIGQGMKKTHGSANPQIMRKLLEKALK